MPASVRPNEADHVLVRHLVGGMIDAYRMWGNLVGLVLACQWHTDDPWVSAPEAASRIGVSDDTARRWLDELVCHGTAMVMTKSRRKFYKAQDVLAQQATIASRRHADEMVRIVAHTAS